MIQMVSDMISDLKRKLAEAEKRARKAEANRYIHLTGTSGLNAYAYICHEDAAKWWFDPVTGERLKRNKGEMIALMHSELSEMLEGVRKDKQDDHLPEMKSEAVEMADLLIRAFDYIGAHGIDIDKAFWAKRKYNLTRADHTHEARAAAGGKRF